MKNTHNKSEAEILRQKAEELLKKKSAGTASPFSEVESIRLIHELQVHQIELEIQNEELLQAQNVAETANDKYVRLYDFAPSGYFTLSKKGGIIELNLSGAKMLGKDRQHLKSSLFGFFVSEETKPIFSLFLEKAFQSSAKESCEIVTDSEGGLPLHVLLTGVVSNNKEHCLVTAVDITERKQAEETVRESKENYRTLIENMGEGVGFLNIEETFVFANPAAEKIFGVDKGKLTGLGLNDFLHGKNIGIVNNEIRIRKQGKNSTYEIEIISKDGSKKDIMVTATPSFRDEKFIGTFGIFRDITDRKQAEEKIKHKNEQLIQANAEKDKFFSIISHDLRGPFNGFLGLSKLLAEDLQRFTPEDIKKIAGSMRDSATNLFSLLENLLEWSRLQRGITSFKPESFLLMPMIDDIMHTVMDSANKKEIEISYEIQADLEVFADEYMLASTIRNLASNAVKFTLKGGKVTIAAKSVPGHSVEISIRDTGIGMNHEMVHDLFRLDVQTNRRGTENEPSSGLGLLLCKDFVEKHGGKLWVESEEGKGSVFYFTIPSNAEGLMKTVISNSVSEEDKEVQIKRMKILIAEDDEISDSLISAMVDKYSYEVLHVNTGVDAIHACLNNPDIDLVLMDINLTGMDGFEATRQIRQFNNDVVIIAQTAFSLKFDRVMAIEAGCNDYINKPISNSELQGLIRKYFTE
jgi:PAS domain S-box-containing protein